jgi:hypothetical protein
MRFLSSARVPPLELIAAPRLPLPYVQLFRLSLPSPQPQQQMMPQQPYGAPPMQEPNGAPPQQMYAEPPQVMMQTPMMGNPRKSGRIFFWPSAAANSRVCSIIMA